MSLKQAGLWLLVKPQAICMSPKVNFYRQLNVGQRIAEGRVQ